MATKVSVAHKVRDYDVWRPGFDGHAAVRQQHGLTNAECTAAPMTRTTSWSCSTPRLARLFWASSQTLR